MSGRGIDKRWPYGLAGHTGLSIQVARGGNKVVWRLLGFHCARRPAIVSLAWRLCCWVWLIDCSCCSCRRCCCRRCCLCVAFWQFNDATRVRWPSIQGLLCIYRAARADNSTRPRFCFESNISFNLRAAAAAAAERRDLRDVAVLLLGVLRASPCSFIIMDVDGHVERTNQRLQAICKQLSGVSADSFADAAVELLHWCEDSRAFRREFEESLLDCLAAIRRACLRPGFDLELGFRVVATCARERDKFSLGSTHRLAQWCEELGQLVLLEHQDRKIEELEPMHPQTLPHQFNAMVNAPPPPPPPLPPPLPPPPPPMLRAGGHPQTKLPAYHQQAYVGGAGAALPMLHPLSRNVLQNDLKPPPPTGFIGGVPRSSAAKLAPFRYAPYSTSYMLNKRVVSMHEHTVPADVTHVSMQPHVGQLTGVGGTGDGGPPHWNPGAGYQPRGGMSAASYPAAQFNLPRAGYHIPPTPPPSLPPPSLPPPAPPPSADAELRLTFNVRDGTVLTPFRLEHNLVVSNHAFNLKESVYGTLMSRQVDFRPRATLSTQMLTECRSTCRTSSCNSNVFITKTEPWHAIGRRACPSPSTTLRCASSEPARVTDALTDRSSSNCCVIPARTVSKSAWRRVAARICSCCKWCTGRRCAACCMACGASANCPPSTASPRSSGSSTAPAFSSHPSPSPSRAPRCTWVLSVPSAHAV